MSELDFATAEALAEMIRAKQLSPVELMDHTLARVEALNPELGAFVALDAERARSEAAAQSERLANGEDLGPVGGLPLGVKDLEDVAGFVTTRGSRAFASDMATRDAVHVERLRAAGAIVVGKTNTPEFGHTLISDNELFPPSRNPWNPAHTPGGSSGGSAAAIAAGIVAIATASDGGGSIRIPASFTGAFGLKTSFGRVPIAPAEAWSWMDTSVYGPLTRTVRDAALYLDVVAGSHPADPNSLPSVDYRYLDRLDEPLEPLRIAFDPTWGARVQPDVARTVTAAVVAFEELGHVVVETSERLPGSELAMWWGRMGGFQSASLMWETYTERRLQISERYLERLDQSIDLSPPEFGEFARARADLTAWCWRMFDAYDLLVTPTMPMDPPPPEGPVQIEVDGELFNPVPFTVPFNFSGHPAATVRAGFSDAGLPVGLQIVGPRHRDDLVLQAAYAYELARPWNDHWPAVGS